MDKTQISRKRQDAEDSARTQNRTDNGKLTSETTNSNRNLKRHRIKTRRTNANNIKKPRPNQRRNLSRNSQARKPKSLKAQEQHPQLTEQVSSKPKHRTQRKHIRNMEQRHLRKMV